MPATVLGTVLCVGLTVFVFVAGLVPVLSWCNGQIILCEERASGSRLSAPEGFYTTRQESDGLGNIVTLDCHPLVTSSAGGKVVSYEPGREVCQVVATTKDPNDQWH